MLQAFENKITELEGNASIESATNIDDSDDVNALWEALENSYKGSEITPEVMYNKAKELFPDNYIAVLNEAFSPNNYEWYDNASANEWYNYMKETFDYEIPGLPFDDGSGSSFNIGDAVIDLDTDRPGEIIDFDEEANEYLIAFDDGDEEWIHFLDLGHVDDNIELSTNINDATTDIQAANEVIDYKYLEELCRYVTANLDDVGYDAVARVEGEYIVIESMYDVASSRYVQPIADIEPNWDDLQDDAKQLSDAYMEAHPDPNYDSEDDEVGDEFEYYDEPKVEY